MRPKYTTRKKMARRFGRVAAYSSLAFLSVAGELNAQDFEGKTITSVDIRYASGAKNVDDFVVGHG
mgnify:CR=1 FL=1